MNNSDSLEPASQSVEALELAMRWRLSTVIGTAAAYFMFACLLLGAAEEIKLLPVAMVPLMIYDVVKILVCALKVFHYHDPDSKEFLKDLVESSIMLLFKAGILLKILQPEVGCMYLLAPPILVIIVRVVMAMGVCSEVNCLYSACRTSFRIFLLMMTWTIVFKVEGQTQLNWSQALWSYWLLFTELVFLSLGSVMLAFHSCFGKSDSPELNFNTIVATIWLTYMFLGFTIASFAVAYVCATNLDSDAPACLTANYALVMYLFVLVVFTLLARKKIIEFGVRFHRRGTEEQSSGRNEDSTVRQIYDNTGPGRRSEIKNVTCQGTTELVNRAIPSLLIRLSNTLFKPIDRREFNSNSTGEISQIALKGLQSNYHLSQLKLTVAHPEPMTEEIKVEAGESNNKLGSERDGSSVSRKGSSKGPLESQSCVICCDKAPDAVLLPCGHGGLCFDCGKRLGKNGGDCYLCRKKFWQVLQLELMANNSTDFVRVVGMHSVIQMHVLPPGKRFLVNMLS